MNYEQFQTLNYLWIAVGIIVFLILLKITAPYGRHTSSKWGPQIDNRLGWVIMEAPALITLLYFMVSSRSNQNTITLILGGLFVFHYINRTFIFPFRLHTKGKKMPVLIAGSGVFFNMVNGSLLGYYFGHFNNYEYRDLLQPHLVFGILLFILGVFINWKYDQKLIRLRQPHSTEYVIPKGGLFKYVSCPNLLGEIIEWTGFAIACCNLPAVAFLVWTIANLVPRAISHHKWYKQRFHDYPEERKAIIPFIL